MAKAKQQEEQTEEVDPDAMPVSNMTIVEVAQPGDPYVGNARVVGGPLPATAGEPGDDGRVPNE